MRFSLPTSVALALVAGCILIDPLDDVALSASGVGGSGGSGGAGGSGGSGGADCLEPTPGTCSAVDVELTGDDGSIAITDMATVDPGGSGAMLFVAKFSGDVSLFGTQVSAGSGTKGLLMEVANGNLVDHVIIDEVDSGSDLRLAITDPFLPETRAAVIVAGTYTEGPPSGDCGATANQGVFARRYELRNSPAPAYDTLWGPYCIDVPDGQVTVEAVCTGVSSSLVVGSFTGTMTDPSGTIASVNGNDDAFMLDFAPTTEMGPTDTVGPSGIFLIEGAGESVARDCLPNHDHEWLIVGDFTGQVTFDPPDPTKSDGATAGEGARDIFITTVDFHPATGDLDFRTFGGDDGGRRTARKLVRDPLLPESVLVAGSLEGRMVFGNVGVDAFESGESAYLLSVIAPIAEPPRETNLELLNHMVLGAESLEVVALEANGRVHVAGHARGDLSAVIGGAAATVVAPATGCQRDAFLLSMRDFAMPSVDRCGDGDQLIGDIGLSLLDQQDEAIWGLNLPAGSVINAGPRHLDQTPLEGSSAIFLYPHMLR